MSDNSIHKTFFKKYIDLNRLVSITSPELCVDCGGVYIQIEMHFQLIENPVIHKEYVAYNSRPDNYHIKYDEKREGRFFVEKLMFRMKDGSYMKLQDISNRDDTLILSKYQKKNELTIRKWKEYKEQ